MDFYCRNQRCAWTLKETYTLSIFESLDWHVTRLFGMTRKNELMQPHFIFFISENIVTMLCWWKLREIGTWKKKNRKNDIKDKETIRKKRRLTPAPSPHFTDTWSQHFNPIYRKMVATCCVRLTTLLRPAATCCVSLAQVWNWSNLSRRQAKMSQYVATGWSNVPSMSYIVPNNCCDYMLRSLCRGLKVFF